jgi:hypothetical protein
MDAQRAREHFKAFAGGLYAEVEAVSLADGTGEKGVGKSDLLGRFFWSDGYSTFPECRCGGK